MSVCLECALGSGLIVEEMSRAAFEVVALAESLALLQFVDNGEVSYESVH